ncbi:hypothetical protein D3C71_1378320 [compost metagenome]
MIVLDFKIPFEFTAAVIQRKLLGLPGVQVGCKQHGLHLSVQLLLRYLRPVAEQMRRDRNRVALLVCLGRNSLQLQIEIVVKNQIDVNLILRNALDLQLPVSFLR